MSDDFGHFDCEVCDEARAKEHHLDIIRAFVERVYKRMDDLKVTENPALAGLEWLYLAGIREELAAMEKEAE